MKLTDKEIEQGLKLATEATPGPWDYEGLGRVTGCLGTPIDEGNRVKVDDNCNFIAFANPKVVQILLEELRELRKQRTQT